MEPVNLLEYETAAREKLEPSIFDYIAGGANDEITLRENHAAYDRIKLRPRVLVDVATIDQSTEILGVPLKMPVVLSVTAAHRLCHPDGELATARAAHAMGTLCTFGTLSNYTIGDAAKISDGPLWFQLYAFTDWSANKFMLDQAVQANAKAIILTVDTPYIGRRERDVRNDFMMPIDLTTGHMLGLPISQVSLSGQGTRNVFRGEALRSRSVTWKDLAKIRDITSLPLILKGVVTAEDARLALEHGVNALIVSNHGGRQLDTCIPTIEALPEVVEAVAGKIPVLVDGGIRRGTDVVKALALGASAVQIGRPLMWGLAVDGAAGVQRVLQLLRDEIELTMALCGKPRISDIDRSLIHLSR